MKCQITRAVFHRKEVINDAAEDKKIREATVLRNFIFLQLQRIKL